MSIRAGKHRAFRDRKSQAKPWLSLIASEINFDSSVLRRNDQLIRGRGRRRARGRFWWRPRHTFTSQLASSDPTRIDPVLPGRWENLFKYRYRRAFCTYLTRGLGRREASRFAYSGTSSSCSSSSSSSNGCVTPDALSRTWYWSGSNRSTSLVSIETIRTNISLPR